MCIVDKNIINIASQCLNCKTHPCNSLCTLKMPINKILNFVKQNKIEEAAKLIYSYSCFPFVCGALCDHEKKCEGSCVLSKKQNGVKYHEVEYELGKAYINELYKKKNENTNHKVAIIGGGICGMTVAIRLLQNGITPVVYEKETKIGGILTNALPTFRYNKDLFNQVINYLESHIEIKYNQEFGKNLLIEDLNDYDDIVFAYGCYKERSSFKESYKAISLLKNKELLNSITNKKVVVIGGGNVAMDISRSLIKLGNDVTIAYRRDLANSPASQKEISETLQDGVKVYECVSPLEINYQNEVITSIKFQKMELYNDGSTRLMFRPLDEYLDIPCDIIVEATGSSGDYSYLQRVYPEIFNSKGWIDTNLSFQTSIAHIYVGGDLNTGPMDFCSAAASGEIIAKSIINLARITSIKGQNIMIGGSFNPPTIAHKEMLKKLNELSPNKIIVLPNGDTYKVNFNDKKLISFNHRFNMCKLITDNISGNFEISDIENNKIFNGTYYTLKHFNHPYFAMGSDCLFDLHKWINYHDLVKENKFIVFTRSSDINKIINFIKEDEFLTNYEDHFVFLEIDFPEVSSSKFRDTLDENLLSKEVAKYIKKNKLFEVENDKQ